MTPTQSSAGNPPYALFHRTRLDVMEFKPTTPRKMLALSLIATCLLIGCGSDDRDAETPQPRTAPANATTPGLSTPTTTDDPTNDPDSFRSPSTGLRFDVPEDWQQQTLDAGLVGIHEAKFLIPTDAGEIEATFSAARGGTQLNLDRWRGQVQSKPDDPRAEEPITVAKHEATWIDLHGSYTPFSGPPKPDHRVVGAAVELGDTDYYIKLIGPREAVAQVLDEFRTMLTEATLN